MAIPLDGRKLYDACRASGPMQVEAFEILGRYLYQIAYNLVRDRAQLHDLAEEGTQEALVTIWQTLDSVEDPDRFLSWASRVVVNKVYDACRRLGVGLDESKEADLPGGGGRRRRVPLNKQDSLEAIHESGGHLQDVVPTQSEPSPNGHMAQRELAEMLSQGIASHPALSVQSKIVLLRGFLADWDDGMLAAALKTTRSNVHTIRSRDLAHLRRDAAFIRLLQEYMKD